MGQLVEQDLRQDGFFMVQKGVEQRVLEPAERGVGLDTLDIDVETLPGEFVGIVFRSGLVEVPAVVE